jgi:superfamily II DNA or RNA helicase
MRFELSKDKQFIQLVEWQTDSEIAKIKTFFRRRNKEFFFNPDFKSGRWDGYDDFFTNGYIPIGLWLELEKFLKNNRYPVDISGIETFINRSFVKEKLIEFTVDLLKDTEIFEPRYYQMEAAFRILKYRYCAAELATSAGKTLISYIVFTYLKKLNLVNKDAKFLLIVPRIPLVTQTADKFEKNYYNGYVAFNLMKLGGKNKFKQKLFDEADCIISTYQSLANLKPELLKKIKHINVDEAHTVQTKTVRDIIETCAPLIYRFGLSGTINMDQDKAEFFRMQKYLGPIVMVLTAEDLIKHEYSPNVNIKIINLHYNQTDPIINGYNYQLETGAAQWADKIEFAKEMYRLERNIIVEYEARVKFIVNLVCSLKMNTLILFNNVKDKYGFNIGELLKARGETVYYIDGSTKEGSREDSTKLMETTNNAKLLASFGTFSTGIDLKSVYNIIFIESYKSPILIRQSIGRGMRELKDKRSINIIDIVDTFGKYSKKHKQERCGIYSRQKFPVLEFDYKL